MPRTRCFFAALNVAVLAMLACATLATTASAQDKARGWGAEHDRSVQLGPRPLYLVGRMDEGPLKAKLKQCAAGPFSVSDFSISHRGAPLQFPEHTKEAYEAGAQMGAGVLECDVTFTKDRQLVCRHSQCDLQTTTNILDRPELAAKCSQPFSPADPATGKPASAKCCTSDVTVSEFKSLCGKMDASNPKATTVKDYMGGTASFRTDLYASCGTLLTHAESIKLFSDLGTTFTPELKAPEVPMPYHGDYTQQAYAQQMIDDYKAADVPPEKVFPQSFNLDDILYWIAKEPAFGKQAVALDEKVDKPGGYEAQIAALPDLAAKGVKIVAPPIWTLVKLDSDGRIIPSEYATTAKASGLDIITWSLERSGTLSDGGGYYYQSVRESIDSDGDMMTVVDVLARQVGVRGIFSDWPATVTYYANCMGL